MIIGESEASYIFNTDSMTSSSQRLFLTYLNCHLNVNFKEY